jgi:hypothetical protein
MSYTTKVNINLTLIMRGNHKREIEDGTINWNTALFKGVITQISPSFIDVKDLGSKVDQVARDQNFYRKIIMKAMPKFMIDKKLRAGC